MLKILSDRPENLSIDIVWPQGLHGGLHFAPNSINLSVFQDFQIFKISKFRKNNKKWWKTHRQTKRFGQNDRNDDSENLKSTSRNQTSQNFPKNFKNNPPVASAGDAKRKQFPTPIYLSIYLFIAKLHIRPSWQRWNCNSRRSGQQRSCCPGPWPSRQPWCSQSNGIR